MARDLTCVDFGQGPKRDADWIVRTVQRDQDFALGPCRVPQKGVQVRIDVMKGKVMPSLSESKGNKITEQRL